MNSLKLVITIFLLTIGRTISACDCNMQGKFLQVAPNTKLVALVKVTKYLSFKEIYDVQTPMSMEVEIIDIYKGEESRKTVIVWGDVGYLCRPYLSRFEEGQYYVIAFEEGLDGSKGEGHKNEKTTDYAISICGQYWLDVDYINKIATGSVSDTQNQITLDALKAGLDIK